MKQSFSIKTDKLNPPLVEALKKHLRFIKAKEVTVSFSSPGKKHRRKETQEETRARIEKAINDTNPEDFISFTGEEFLALSKVLPTIK